MLIRVFLLLLICIPLGNCRSVSRNRLDNAEELLRQEKYDEAIVLYKEHMKNRLGTKNKPEWENPYFYHLFIGDTELRRSNVTEAIENYKIARDNGIHSGLISDRMRYVASWYEEQGKLEESIEFLKTNRELDPLLFDAMLDRISKEIIYRQDQSNHGPN